jgi:hypothetical protein
VAELVVVVALGDPSSTGTYLDIFLIANSSCSTSTSTSTSRCGSCTSSTSTGSTSTGRRMVV